jgi:heme a synthase
MLYGPGARMLEKAHTPRDERRSLRALGNAFLALVGLTSGLMVLGALVRAHGAGLACPDWPLCFGQVIPQMDFEIAFEWSHRAVAGVLALLFAALGFALARQPRAREMLPLWSLAALLLIVQIVLGGLTVLKLLAAWTVTSHLVVANAFNLCLLLIGLRLREAAATHPRRALPARARAWWTAAAVLLAVQTVLGGLVSSRYAGLACPEWPTCLAGVWFPTLHGPVGLHLSHRMTGYALVLLLGTAALATRGLGRVSHLGALAAALGLVQVAVGVANVRMLVPVEVTGLHSALAALMVLTVGAAAHEAWRAPRVVTGSVSQAHHAKTRPPARAAAAGGAPCAPTRSSPG